MSARTPDILAEAYARISAANRRLLDKLAHVLTIFQDKGVDCIVLKGADVLPRLYGVMGIRPMVDADLLVRERDLPVIDTILTGLGFVPQIDGTPAYRDPESHLLLDLTTEIWYADDLEAIWSRAIERTVAGLMVKGMGSDDLLIFLTAYSVLHRGHFQPSFAQDITLLAGKEPMDWDFILDEASRLNLKIPLYYGLSHVSRAEYATIPARVLLRLAPTTLMERIWHALLKRLVTDRPIDDIGHLLMLIALPWNRKWRRLKQMVWPPPSFLKYRYGKQGAAVPVVTRMVRAIQLAWQAHLLSWRLLGRFVGQR